MLDLSAEEIDFNLSECERLLKRMSPIGMSCNELGFTEEEDGVGSDDDIGADNPLLYTQPEDCLRACKLSPIGHFSQSLLVMSRCYKPGNVKLTPEILKMHKSLFKAPVTLMKNHWILLQDLDLMGQNCGSLSYGVFKMNIDGDTWFAVSKAGKYVEENQKHLNIRLTLMMARHIKRSMIQEYGLGQKFS